MKQSILHSCVCFTSNGMAVIIQESVVFQRGNPKTGVYTVQGRKRQHFHFNDILHSLYFSLLSALFSLQICFIHSSVTNRYLEIPKNPAYGLKATQALTFKSVLLPGFLVSITGEVVVPPKLHCSSLRCNST